MFAVALVGPWTVSWFTTMPPPKLATLELCAQCVAERVCALPGVSPGGVLVGLSCVGAAGPATTVKKELPNEPLDCADSAPVVNVTVRCPSVVVGLMVMLTVGGERCG